MLLNTPDFDPNFLLKSYGGEGTPLYIACSKAHSEIVKELLKHNSIDVNAKSYLLEYDETPLYIACSFGHSEIVKELLKHNSIELEKETLKLKMKQPTFNNLI